MPATFASTVSKIIFGNSPGVFVAQLLFGSMSCLWEGSIVGWVGCWTLWGLVMSGWGISIRGTFWTVGFIDGAVMGFGCKSVGPWVMMIVSIVSSLSPEQLFQVSLFSLSVHSPQTYFFPPLKSLFSKNAISPQSNPATSPLTPPPPHHTQTPSLNYPSPHPLLFPYPQHSSTCPCDWNNSCIPHPGKSPPCPSTDCWCFLEGRFCFIGCY